MLFDIKDGKLKNNYYLTIVNFLSLFYKIRLQIRLTENERNI